MEEQQKRRKLLDSYNRTQDVVAKGEDSLLTFNDLFLSDSTISGLFLCGFTKPSPVQLASIPYAKLGCDLIIQAKSGTGKTCVYAVVILERIIEVRNKQSASSHSFQAMIIVPTRELVIQTKQVFQKLVQAAECKIGKIRMVTCFGGTAVQEDHKNIQQGVDIIIGTPGRIRNLIYSSVLSLDYIQILVLDEVDKLLESSLYKDFLYIEQHIPSLKQTLAFSATYSTTVLLMLENRMKQPRKITVSKEMTLKEVVPEKVTQDSSLHREAILIGISHYKAKITDLSENMDYLNVLLQTLLSLFGEFCFHQCLIFYNEKSMLDKLCYGLRHAGFSAAYTSGNLKQSMRNEEIFSNFYAHNTNILLTTDLLSRGVDFVECNLVINLDIPCDYKTYLHRAGRAGRFGKLGNCVTVYSDRNESAIWRLEKEIEGLVMEPLQVEIVLENSATENTLPMHPQQEHEQKNEQEEMTRINQKEENIMACEHEGAFIPDQGHEGAYFYWKGYWYGYFLAQWYLWHGEMPPQDID
eukprot:jgi/Galph1/3063/GphlegSOOS_G1715.1